MDLANAIDALLAFLQDSAGELDHERMQRFKELDTELYVLACLAGIDGKLPQQDDLVRMYEFSELPTAVIFEGKVNLPGDWYVPSVFSAERVFLPVTIGRWHDEMLAFRSLASSVPSSETKADTVAAPPKKQTGRPRKNEKGSDTLIKDAIAFHHDYDSYEGELVGNPEPASGQRLAELSGVKEGTVSKFMKKEFGSHDEYRSVCHIGIGARIARWRGDISPEFLDKMQYHTHRNETARRRELGIDREEDE